MLVQWNSARKHFEKMSFNKYDIRRGIIGDNYTFEDNNSFFQLMDVDIVFDVLNKMEYIYPEILFDDKRKRFIILNNDYTTKVTQEINAILLHNTDVYELYRIAVKSNDPNVCIRLWSYPKLSKTEIFNIYKNRLREPWLYENSSTW